MYPYGRVFIALAKLVRNGKRSLEGLMSQWPEDIVLIQAQAVRLSLCVGPQAYAGPLVSDLSDDDSTDSDEEEGETSADDRHVVGGAALGAGPLSHTRRAYRRKVGFVKQLTKKLIDADRAKYCNDGLTALMMRSHIGVLRRARECSIDPTDSRLNSQTNNYRPVDE